jgi:hypothetical protein
MCYSDLRSVEISGGAIIERNYELCGKVVNKSNIKSKTPSRVTLRLRDNIVDVRMNGTQNKIIISQIEFIIHIYGLHHCNGNPSEFFSEYITF